MKTAACNPCRKRARSNGTWPIPPGSLRPLYCSIYEKPFKPFHEAFSPMFSSYNAKGQTKPDSKRGLFTRPSLGEVRQYCHDVDERMNRVLDQAGDDEMLRMLTVLGMNHEQQHQELMLTDIKHLLSQSPLDPCYRSEALQQEQVSQGTTASPGMASLHGRGSGNRTSRR